MNTKRWLDYSPYNRTPGEWGMMQVGFVIVLAFHLVLFARYLVRTAVAPSPRPHQ